jgi:hypothetical protein
MEGRDVELWPLLRNLVRPGGKAHKKEEILGSRHKKREKYKKNLEKGNGMVLNLC